MSMDSITIFQNIYDALNDQRIEHWQRLSSVEIFAKKLPLNDRVRIMNLLDVGVSLFGGWRQLFLDQKATLNNKNCIELLNDVGAHQMALLFGEIKSYLNVNGISIDGNNLVRLAENMYAGEEEDNPKLRNGLDDLFARHELHNRDKVIPALVECLKKYLSNRIEILKVT